MIKLTNYDYKQAIILSVCTLIFYLLFSWTLPITDTVESNYALSAVEMMRHGEFLSPMIYEKYWFDKPIFTYWTLIASFSIFGISDWAARIPSAISAALTVGGMYLGAIKITGARRIGFISTIILATSLEFWYISHAVLTDGHLMLFSLGILVYAWIGLTQQKWTYMAGAYTCAGMAVLVKGPVGLVLPGLILLAITLWKRNELSLGMLFHPLGILAFFLVASPWYLWMYYVHGQGFIDGFLGLHNYVRATVPEHPEQNWWFLYLALLPLSLLPWTGVAMYSILRMKSSLWRTYLWVWLIGVIGFYTAMATKYITYTYIGLLPLVILTAHGLVAMKGAEEQGSLGKRTLWWLWGPAIFLIILLGSIAIAALHSKMNVIGLVIGSGLGAGALFYGMRQNTVKAATMTVLLGSIFFYLGLAGTLGPILHEQSGKLVASYVQTLPESQRKTIYYYGSYRTSFTYYMGETAVFIPYKDKDDVWEEGKNIMPVQRWDAIDTSRPSLADSIICVPKKYETYFQRTGLAKRVKPIQEVNGVTIYQGL